MTIDGKARRARAASFMVVATQNPLEQQGTYPLPEAQLDRFLFKQALDYPRRDEERPIVADYGMQPRSVPTRRRGRRSGGRRRKQLTEAAATRSPACS